MKKILSMLLIALLALNICLSATAESPALTLTCPSGAPALAVATLAAVHPENFNFIAADTIAAEFASANADFIIAPLNAGAKLFKAGKSSYKLCAVVSWGNLYFASQKANFQLSDINGAELTLFGENTINASIALFALNQNGIVPSSVAYLAGAANTQALLLSDADAIVLTAEPALTAARFKNDAVTAYALNDLYQAATGNGGFAQAALFVRADTLASQPEAVTDYLKQVEQAATACTENPEAVAEAAVALEILPNAKVALSALPNCAVRYVSALEAREQIETTAKVDLSQYGGDVPADDFYYGAQ